MGTLRRFYDWAKWAIRNRRVTPVPPVRMAVTSDRPRPVRKRRPQGGNPPGTKIAKQARKHVLGMINP